MKLKVFQALVALGFVVANIHFNWGIDGLAISVIGGMVAWYATGLLVAAVDRVRLGSVPASRGQLDEFVSKAAEAKRQRQLHDQ